MGSTPLEGTGKWTYHNDTNKTLTVTRQGKGLARIKEQKCVKNQNGNGITCHFKVNDAENSYDV